MCEKCKNLAERADSLRAIVGEEKFDELWYSTLSESATVSVPIALVKLIFPLLVWLNVGDDNELNLGAGMACLTDLASIRATLNRHAPLNLFIARDALDRVCHEVGVFHLECMERGA